MASGDDSDTFTAIPHFQTDAIHVGGDPKRWTSRSVVPPIHMSTTFQQDSPNSNPFVYGRSGNPSRLSLEQNLAALEGAKHASAFASGLATLNTLVHLLKPGDELVAMDDLYGGSNRFFRHVAAPSGIVVKVLDLSDSDALKPALSSLTKMIWLETPTNPLMKLCDIEALCKIAHDYSPEIIVAVDNTFMSPYFQRPLELGADAVVHSCTKYINGHSDVIMGCVCVNDDDLAKRIGFLQNSIGAIPSPFDCFLVMRGVKTLALRMREHQRNGFRVARHLEKHPLVLRVIHPGLESHPQHALFRRQCRGFSGMVSFYLRRRVGSDEPASIEQSIVFLQALRVFTLAESLGGYESLAEVPALMTHASVPQEDRRRLGIGDNLIRVSCGVEDADDLVADVDRAANAAAEAGAGGSD